MGTIQVVLGTTHHRDTQSTDDPSQGSRHVALPYSSKIDHVDQLGSTSLGDFYCSRGLLRRSQV